MRSFKTKIKFDAAIITGRSTSYLTTAEDFKNTLTTIRNLLNNDGLLLFDCIDGSKFLPYIMQNPEVIHKAKIKNTHYYRETNWRAKDSTKTKLVSWDSKYFKENDGKTILLGNDSTVFKVF